MNSQHDGDRGTWSVPEYVMVGSITVVEHGRLPIDEAVVKDIMATIGAGDMSALPPIHLWRKQPGGNPILVAGRNRLAAHKRCGCEVISARVITGDTPEIVRAIQLIEIDENLNRRELSPALRRSLSKQRKALYEEEHPETKRGSAGGRAKAGRGAKSQNATEQTPAFIDAHAKQTGRHRATIAREISEAEKIGDDVMKRIVGTSLDKRSEITALAAMDELERQEIVDRAVAGEKVSAAKIRREANIRRRIKQSAHDCNPEAPNTENLEPGDTPEVIRDGEQSHRDAAAAEDYTRWLPRYEAVKAKQAALAQELEDLLRRIEQVDGEARRVNDAKPLTSHGDGRLLGDMESIARTGGLSIIKRLEGDSVSVSPPSPPLSVQLAAIMAAIPMPAIGPEQINARNAALMREENEVISRYVADQLNRRAREAAEARAEQEELRRRRAGGK
jgi:ParB family chromosome partitioning protein